MIKRTLLRLCLFALLPILFIVFLPRQQAPVASNGGALFVTSWGSDVTSSGKFKKPLGIAADSSGLVYVADSRNSRIQVFNASGTYLSAWGSFGTGNGQFNLPSDVAIDSVGNVYVADAGNHRIQKFTSTGVYITQWGGSGSGNGQFNQPHGVVIDAEGNVYLTGKGVTVFNAAGEQIENIPVPESWTANVTFGGKDRDTLFITASDSLYSVKTRVKGAY